MWWRIAVQPEIRIGCSGWHYRSWSGPFYPPEVGATGLLSFYAQHFDTTEINSAFYRLPTENAVEAWREGTPEGFLFAWKVSRFITHMKRLKDIEDSIALVFGRMAGLGDRLGPALFQLPPTFEAADETTERVKRCLDIIPAGRRCAFEFRHPSWYRGCRLRPAAQPQRGALHLRPRGRSGPLDRHGGFRLPAGARDERTL